MDPVIVGARIECESGKPRSTMKQVLAMLAGAEKPVSLFWFYEEEIRFTEEELLGLTVVEAQALYRSKVWPEIPPPARPPLPLGTPTQWGTIKAVSSQGGERSYFMVDKFNIVALIPAEIAEAAYDAEEKS